MGQTVTISRIPRHVKWGVKDSNGKLKEKYDECFDKWVPGLNKTSGALNIPTFSKKDEEIFEQALGLEKDALKKGSKFWDNYSVIIPAGGLVLDLDEPISRLNFLLFSADPEFSVSLDDAKINPRAVYVMTTKGAEAKVANSKRDVIAQAFSIYAKMSRTEVEDALLMLGKDVDFSEPEVAKNLLGEELEKNPGKFLTIVGDENFTQKVWLIRCIRSGLIKKQGHGLGYELPLWFGDIPLGTGLDNAIKYLLDPENANIYIGLKKGFEEIKKLG